MEYEPVLQTSFILTEGSKPSRKKKERRMIEEESLSKRIGGKEGIAF